MKKIEALKKDCDVRMSEELFELTAPVEFQCPNFDRVVKAIDKAYESLQYRGREDAGDIDLALEKITDAEWELRNLSDEVEDLRDAIGAVRDWGNEWKNLAKRIVEENDIEIEKYVIKGQF